MCARNLQKQCMYMTYFNIFPKLFSKIQVAKLRVQLICKCSLSAVIYSTFQAIIYVIYSMTVISTCCWRQMVSTPMQEGSIQSSLVKWKLSPNRLLSKEILQDGNSSVKLFECVFLAVDPVVEGKTRSEQFYRGDTQGKKVQ